jgi:HTH-type transcriptional regulator, sugar sensing transcriptional regulator
MDLKEIGITENESKVYLALVDLGPSLAGAISGKTGMHRRSVYDAAEMLIKKGLVCYILKNNRKVFQASNPQRILEVLDEKKDMLDPLIKILKEKYIKTKEKEETNFYKGKEGLKAVFEDQLESKEVLILGATVKAYEVLQFYFKWYDKTRKKRKIKARILAQDRSIKKIPLAEIKYLPEKYSNPVSVNIYGDKTAIILWASEPLAIVIKNKEITDGYKNYFELLWKIAKR